MVATDATSDADSTSNHAMIDSENGVEIARLIDEEALFTQALGGLFPEQPDLSHVECILDIGCGPGAWVNNVAFEYPDIQVVGIDSNRTIVEYARAMAYVQRLENAAFTVMDVHKPLAFEDHSFDLVNGCFLTSYLDQVCWPQLIAECKRVLIPGGILRLTECEVSLSNSLALQRLKGTLYQALRKHGRTFSVDGHSIGITHMLGKLLRDAGFEQIEQHPVLIDASLGSELYHSVRKHLAIFFLLLKSFLINADVIGEVEFDALYQAMTLDMLQDDFTCISFGLIAWGQTPDTLK